jgi:hypothetical protein
VNTKKLLTGVGIFFAGRFIYRKIKAVDLVAVTVDAKPKSINLAGDNQSINILQPFLITNRSIETLAFNRVGGAVFASGVQVGTYLYNQITTLPAQSSVSVDVVVQLNGPMLLKVLPDLVRSAGTYNFDLGYNIQVGILSFADTVNFSVPSMQSYLQPFSDIFSSTSSENRSYAEVACI